MSPALALCRTCGHRQPVGRRHCATCASSRLLSHDELDSLAIAHIDCDAFFASIEKRDDPSLEGKPVIIGGGRRGVVATACYVARTFGVKSAMPMFKALELCPDAVVIRPDIRKYARIGREIRDRMLSLTPLVEPLTIDEAFLDLSGTQKLHKASPAETLSRFQRAIESELGLSVSVGLSHVKFLAKMASDLDKPRGFSVIGKAETLNFLAPLPVSAIFGIGPKATDKLRQEGYKTIADLQKADLASLVRQLGESGMRLHKLANGIDNRPIIATRKRKSVSSETTFDSDISDLSELLAVLRAQSERVAHDLKSKELAGRTITLKVKTSGFKTLTRSHTLDDATALADRLFREGSWLLTPLADGTRYRLLGIGVSELCARRLADEGDLLDPEAGKRAKAEEAMDMIRARFGSKTIGVGRIFNRRIKLRESEPEETEE